MTNTDGHDTIEETGNGITYDEIGNPLTYYNGMEFKWTMGRRLESVKNGNTNVSYTYNVDGLRTSKTVNNVKYNYYWDGDKLTGQTWQGNTLYFYYDKDGNPIGFDLNNNNYYYVTNLQGDIIAILSSSNGLLAEYEYDAWGNCTILYDTNDIADINPLRYRGYYYDTDTNLYYLQSRYYDANIGRFINADDAAMIMHNVYNLFTYCENAPTMGIDPSGTWVYHVVKPNKIPKNFLEISNPFYDLNLIAYNNMSKNNKLYADFVKANSYRKDTYSLSKSTPIINNQKAKYIKDMKYGNNRLEKCGCEIIATYNLLILINKPQKLTSIINEFELNNMYYFGAFTRGGFGTDPDDLYKYFKAHKIKYSKTKKLKDLKSQLEKKKSGKFIVGFWNNKRYLSSIHTVCVRKNANSNYVTVYNLYSDTGTKTITVNQFIKIISKEGSFITSYKF